MQALDIIRRVRDRQRVSPDAIKDFVAGVSNGAIPDYQATAFLMAVYLNGLDDDLTVALTLAMRDSGQVIDLSDVPGVKVDKHSTGGVGDKISIPLAPLVAACGVPVPMVSGRGLGHTGGTLDKLESIPGFRVDLSTEQFQKHVRDLAICLIGQTAELAPADKKLYALRDVTATVESVPLITSSILAKKLAEGIDALVLDVKVGAGAFMKDEPSARRLAQSLVRVGTGAGLKVRAVLTRMEEPLGTTIGNALEVRESVAILRGDGPADTTELTLALGAEMLIMADVAKTADLARQKLLKAIGSGAALEKLRDVVAAQGGDANVIDEPERLPAAAHQTAVVAQKRGYVSGIDAYTLGVCAMQLGAGRARAEDAIDPAVGIEMQIRRGDSVGPGDVLCTVHHNGPLTSHLDAIRGAFDIEDAAPAEAPLIIDVVGA